MKEAEDDAEEAGRENDNHESQKDMQEDIDLYAHPALTEACRPLLKRGTEARTELLDQVEADHCSGHHECVN